MREDGLAIPPRALAELYRHAREAFPRECCGYLVGHGENVEIVSCSNRQDALHAMDPLQFPRTAETAYDIGGRELLALVRSFDSATPATVIYHSHPRVGAYFSEEDTRAAVAAAYPVDYLVIDVQERFVAGAALFRRHDTDGDVRYVEVARFPGLAV